MSCWDDPHFCTYNWDMKYWTQHPSLLNWRHDTACVYTSKRSVSHDCKVSRTVSAKYAHMLFRRAAYVLPCQYRCGYFIIRTWRNTWVTGSLMHAFCRVALPDLCPLTRVPLNHVRCHTPKVVFVHGGCGFMHENACVNQLSRAWMAFTTDRCVLWIFGSIFRRHATTNLE